MFIKMSLLSKNTLKKYNLFHWENTSGPRLNFTPQKMRDFYLTSSWEAFSYFSSFVSIKINSRHTVRKWEGRAQRQFAAKGSLVLNLILGFSFKGGQNEQSPGLNETAMGH